MDRDKMAQGIRIFLEGIGEGVGADDSERTAARVAEAWARDLVSGYDADPQELLIDYHKRLAEITELKNMLKKQLQTALEG